MTTRTEWELTGVRGRTVVSAWPNETNKDEVLADVTAFVDRVLTGAP